LHVYYVIFVLLFKLFTVIFVGILKKVIWICTWKNWWLWEDPNGSWRLVCLRFVA